MGDDGGDQVQRDMRQNMQNFDGRRFREAIGRHWCDHQQSFALYLQDRPYGEFDIFPQNVKDQFRHHLPSFCYPNVGPNITCTFVKHKNHANRAPANGLAWQPDGRRIAMGDQNGRITFFNGYMFKFDFPIDGHVDPYDSSRGVPITDLLWSHSGDFLLSVDETGLLKVWQSNIACISEFNIATPESQIHKISQLSFSPNDRKFAASSEDSYVRVWDLATQTADNTFSGHPEGVRCLDWHPCDSIIASGGKDNFILFHDPREDTETPIARISAHHGHVTRIHWNPDGNLLLSGSRDSTVAVTDTRMMEPMQHFAGHDKEVFTVQWHPFCHDLFVTSGFSGDMHWFALGMERPLYSIAKAHNQAVYQLKFSPLGNILASVGKEGVVKTWIRNNIGTDWSRNHYELSKAAAHTEAAPGTSALEEAIPGLLPYNELYEEDEHASAGWREEE